MDIVTSSPIPADVMRRFVDETLEKHYVKDGTYSIYRDQNDDYSSLYESAWDSEDDERFSPDALLMQFYENFLFDWYNDYESSVLLEIRDTLSSKVSDYAIDENLPAGDVENQLNTEIENITDNIEFDYTDIERGIVSDVSSWLTGVNEALSSVEIANAVATKMTRTEADFLSKVMKIDAFKAWFIDQYGIDGSNYSDEIDSILQTLDSDKHDELRRDLAEDDDEYEVQVAKATRDIVDTTSAEEIIDCYEDMGLDEVVYHIKDYVFAEV